MLSLKIIGLVGFIFLLQQLGLLPLLHMFSLINKLPWMKYISSLICLPIISSSYIIHPKNERASSQERCMESFLEETGCFKQNINANVIRYQSFLRFVCTWRWIYLKVKCIYSSDCIMYLIRHIQFLFYYYNIPKLNHARKNIRF